MGLRARFFPFSSYDSADLSSELFHQQIVSFILLFILPFILLLIFSFSFFSSLYIAVQLSRCLLQLKDYSADSNSEFFREHAIFLQETTFPQPFSIGRTSN